MKAVISNKIYVQGEPEELEAIKKELSYTLWKRTNTTSKPVQRYTFTNINETTIAIPSGRLDLLPKGTPLIDKRVLAPVDFPDFSFTLRNDQQAIYERVTDSCIINANPSWGKTFCGIAIATKLGQKTLIVVHTLFLLEQWRKEVEKTLGIRAGVITSQAVNTNSPIVITNIQTFKKRENSFRDTFGTLIVDECHHTPASTFTKIVSASKARYKIGLSATLTRSDGEDIVLTDYFSPTIYKPVDSNSLSPKILRLSTDIPLSDDMNQPWALKINDLYNDPNYQQLIANLIADVYEAGYVTLVVSDRVDFLELLHGLYEEESVLVIGKSKDREEKLEQVREGDCRLVFGTTSIFAEGISISALSCLLPAVPISSEGLVEQLIGRVARIHPGKTTPLVFDIILQGSTARKQANNRLRVYKRKEYEVENIYLPDTNYKKILLT